VYQIQLKFRDDPRPRAGLIRTREFTMKDAYSLDRDQAGLDAQYDRIYRAYLNIFSRCDLPVIAVGADVGMMGGSEAHEFMYPTPIGEDTIVLCDRCGYAQNRQVATFAKPDPVAEEPAALERVATPGASTIEALSTFLDIPPARTAKVVFMAATTGGGQDVPVVAVVRGDMSLNETKLANTVGAAELRPMTGDEIVSIGCVPGYDDCRRRSDRLLGQPCRRCQ
jgi:prolyl-tRNA synthetase